jgi:hypothetical protein
MKDTASHGNREVAGVHLQREPRIGGPGVFARQVVDSQPGGYRKPRCREEQQFGEGAEMVPARSGPGQGAGGGTRRERSRRRDCPFQGLTDPGCFQASTEKHSSEKRITLHSKADALQAPRKIEHSEARIGPARGGGDAEPQGRQWSDLPESTGKHCGEGRPAAMVGPAVPRNAQLRRGQVVLTESHYLEFASRKHSCRTPYPFEGYR